MKYFLFLMLLSILFFSFTAGEVTALELESDAFENREFIPEKCTGAGRDVSPPLNWSDAPAGTKSFAVICDDPDAPAGTWVHWVIYNIPSNVCRLTGGLSASKTLANGAKQGINDFEKIGYKGPYPPKGKQHKYYFKLYALDIKLDLEPGATKAQLRSAMQGHILAEKRLIGYFKR